MGWMAGSSRITMYTSAVASVAAGTGTREGRVDIGSMSASRVLHLEASRCSRAPILSSHYLESSRFVQRLQVMAAWRVPRMPHSVSPRPVALREEAEGACSSKTFGTIPMLLRAAATAASSKASRSASGSVNAASMSSWSEQRHLPSLEP